MRTRTSGRTKASLDILLWRSDAAWSNDEINTFVALGVFDQYLAGIAAPKLTVTVHFPAHLELRMLAFHRLVTQSVGDVDLASADDYQRLIHETDADLVLAPTDNTLPALDTLLIVTEVKHVLREVELFVRGFDVPYSFRFPLYGMPWTNFYLMCDRDIFDPLMRYQNSLARSGPADAAEFGRTLVYNSLPNVLFTRDRYDFYIQQQRMAKRRNWDHQDFIFETGYALNNFYMLTYSALDQLALAINAKLEVGILERRVGFGYDSFRKAVAEKNSSIYGFMNSKTATDLVDMLDVLRNHAAHRGSLLPTTIYQPPESEPTDEELDAKARELGYDEDYEFFPPGELRDSAKAMARFKARLKLYSIAAEKVLVIDRDDRRYLINPSPNLDCDRLIEVVETIMEALTAL